jgi:hypothetical protein
MYVKTTPKELKNSIKENGTPEGLLNGLLDCISILSSHERSKLEEIVKELKQNHRGEGWAVGEMLQRVIYFLVNTDGFEGYKNESDIYTIVNFLKKMEEDNGNMPIMIFRNGEYFKIKNAYYAGEFIGIE